MANNTKRNLEKAIRILTPGGRMQGYGEQIKNYAKTDVGKNIGNSIYEAGSYTRNLGRKLNGRIIEGGAKALDGAQRFSRYLGEQFGDGFSKQYSQNVNPVSSQGQTNSTAAAAPIVSASDEAVASAPKYSTAAPITDSEEETVAEVKKYNSTPPKPTATGNGDTVTTNTPMTAGDEVVATAKSYASGLTNYPEVTNSLKEATESVNKQYQTALEYAEKSKQNAYERADDEQRIAMRDAQANYITNDARYGANAEDLLSQGLENSGYSEHLLGKREEQLANERMAARSQASAAKKSADEAYDNAIYTAGYNKAAAEQQLATQKAGYAAQLGTADKDREQNASQFQQNLNWDKQKWADQKEQFLENLNWDKTKWGEQLAESRADRQQNAEQFAANYELALRELNEKYGEASDSGIVDYGSLIANVISVGANAPQWLVRAWLTSSYPNLTEAEREELIEGMYDENGQFKGLVNSHDDGGKGPYDDLYLYLNDHNGDGVVDDADKKIAFYNYLTSTKEDEGITITLAGNQTAKVKFTEDQIKMLYETFGSVEGVVSLFNSNCWIGYPDNLQGLKAKDEAEGYEEFYWYELEGGLVFVSALGFYDPAEGIPDDDRTIIPNTIPGVKPEGPPEEKPGVVYTGTAKTMNAVVNEGVFNKIKLKNGDNFSVDLDGKKYDVQLGSETASSMTDVDVSKVGNNEIFGYDGELYLMYKGEAYRIEARPSAKNSFKKLYEQFYPDNSSSGGGFWKGIADFFGNLFGKKNKMTATADDPIQYTSASMISENAGAADGNGRVVVNVGVHNYNVRIGGANPSISCEGLDNNEVFLVAGEMYVNRGGTAYLITERNTNVQDYETLKSRLFAAVDSYAGYDDTVNNVGIKLNTNKTTVDKMNSYINKNQTDQPINLSYQGQTYTATVRAVYNDESKVYKAAKDKDIGVGHVFTYKGEYYIKGNYGCLKITLDNAYLGALVQTDSGEASTEIDPGVSNSNTGEPESVKIDTLGPVLNLTTYKPEGLTYNGNKLGKDKYNTYTLSHKDAADEQPDLYEKFYNAATGAYMYNGKLYYLIKNENTGEVILYEIHDGVI